MHRILPIALVALVACGEKDDTAGFDYASFEGGTFQFTTNAVSDACYDGSMELVFMPEGTANDWAATTELPGWADLPASYNLALPEPFLAMDVTVEDGGEATLSLAPTAQPDLVPLDEDNYPDCMVTMEISATLTIVDADNIQGTATLTTTGMSDDKDCPQDYLEDPCDISLDVVAARQ